MSIFTRSFWKHTAERVIATAAEVAGATLIANATNLWNVNWQIVTGISGLAALLTLLKCIGSGYVGNDSPSLVD